MYLLEYFSSLPLKDNVMLEFGPPGGAHPPDGAAGGRLPPPRTPPGVPMSPGQDPSSSGLPSTGLIEFEDIKKYVLFGKLKELKLKLELANINRKDPDTLKLFEFINLLMMFYNTFTYEQAQQLIDILLEMMSSLLKIKIPEKELNEPAFDNDKIQSILQNQLSAQQQDQTSQIKDQLDQKNQELDHHKKEAQLAKKETALAKKGATLAQQTAQTTKKKR